MRPTIIVYPTHIIVAVTHTVHCGVRHGNHHQKCVGEADDETQTDSVTVARNSRCKTFRNLCCRKNCEYQVKGASNEVPYTLLLILQTRVHLQEWSMAHKPNADLCKKQKQSLQKGSLSSVGLGSNVWTSTTPQGRLLLVCFMYGRAF